MNHRKIQSAEVVESGVIKVNGQMFGVTANLTDFIGSTIRFARRPFAKSRRVTFVRKGDVFKARLAKKTVVLNQADVVAQLGVGTHTKSFGVWYAR